MAAQGETQSAMPMVPAKRARASKPKVRTGCITCKIRRIKCDEGKPACKRCVSTGRTCDGYGVAVRPKPSEQQIAVVGRSSQVHQGAGRFVANSTYLCPLRPLVADISGDHFERLYFHRFRQIGQEAVGIRHAHNSMFWKHVIPLYCHEFDSVKHAYIAFSAAYHNFLIVGAQPDRSAPPTNIERFIIKQYNLAMRSIGKETQGLLVKKQYGVILVCCLAFFCVEILRNEWSAALTHLANGRRLMANPPDEVANLFKDPLKGTQAMDTAYGRVTYMLKLLSRWELSAGLLSEDFRPSLALNVYESRKFDSAVASNVGSVADLRDAVGEFCQDVNALTWQTKSHKGSAEYWRQTVPSMQHSVLQQRAQHLAGQFEEHQDDSEGQEQSSEYTSFHLSLLHFRCTSLSLDMLLVPSEAEYPLLPEERARFEEILQTSGIFRTALQNSVGTRSPLSFNADLGVLPMLNVVASNCRDAVMKEKIIQMIKDWPHGENLWDGPALRQMLSVAHEGPNYGSPASSAGGSGSDTSGWTRVVELRPGATDSE